MDIHEAKNVLSSCKEMVEDNSVPPEIRQAYALLAIAAAIRIAGQQIAEEIEAYRESM